MSGAHSGWSSMLLVGLAMLVIGVRMNLLSMQELVSRCGACGRLRRKGTVCPCARQGTRAGDD